MTVLIILAILIAIVLFLGYTICRSAQKLHPDQNNPNLWRDDEGNEYEF